MERVELANLEVLDEGVAEDAVRSIEAVNWSAVCCSRAKKPVMRR